MLQSLLSRLKAWCFHSLTIAWGYFKILFGALLLMGHELYVYVDQIAGDTDVKQALAAMNFPPYVGLGLAVIGCITIAARLRTVTKATTAENIVVTP